MQENQNSRFNVIGAVLLSVLAFLFLANMLHDYLTNDVLRYGLKYRFFGNPVIKCGNQLTKIDDIYRFDGLAVYVRESGEWKQFCVPESSENIIQVYKIGGGSFTCHTKHNLSKTFGDGVYRINKEVIDFEFPSIQWESRFEGRQSDFMSSRKECVRVE
uniref:hypothetical protein n=1 Tax=Rheinheimera sp. TaxID=1869214 RepID=UPI004048C1E9